MLDGQGSLSRVTVDLVLGPGDDLLDRLAVAQAGEHLVVDAAAVDLHRDFGRRFGCGQRRLLPAGGRIG